MKASVGRVGMVALLVLGACSGGGDGSDGAGPAAASTTTEAEAPSATSTTVAEGTCPDRIDLPYLEGGDPLQRLDLFRPPGAGCEPLPVVVWVHGGGWSIGDKRNQMDPKLALWHEAGWAVASVNYRLTDVDAPEGERVLAPDHNEDVAAAVAYLLAEADALGLDAERVALLGHSAGAGIVAALATDPAYLAEHDLLPTDLSCVAPLDTEGFDITTVVADGGQAATLYRSVFGDDPAGWAELSPLTHVGEADLPDLLLVRRGGPERRAQVATFADAVEGAGGAVTVLDVTGYSHGDVNRRIGDPTDELLTPPLQTFLAGCLAP